MANHLSEDVLTQVVGYSWAKTPLSAALILVLLFLFLSWILKSWGFLRLFVLVSSMRIPSIAPFRMQKITIAVERCPGDFQFGRYLAEKDGITKRVRYSSLYLTSLSASPQGSRRGSPCDVYQAGSRELSSQSKFNVRSAARFVYRGV